jgi:hypothetical protein
MAVTGCNYGSHPFIHRPAPGFTTQHMHSCPDCGALYFASGLGPCYACRPRKEEN